MTPALPHAFLTTPLAHRALHDVAHGRPENSRAAIRAAMAAGYGIEIDVQASADQWAMVFHDYDMKRLTGQAGAIGQVTAEQAGRIPLAGGDGETIPTLDEVLQIVGGKIPVLIEIKDQDGGMGPDVGPLEADVARCLAGYDGPVAVMSFNPHSVAEMARLAPDVPRGLTTDPYRPDEWPLPVETCERLRAIPDFDRVNASFISHYAADLDRAEVQALKARGVPVLCWTIRSAQDEAEARRIADNVTFEGYLAEIPA